LRVAPKPPDVTRKGTAARSVMAAVTAVMLCGMTAAFSAVPTQVFVAGDTHTRDSHSHHLSDAEAEHWSARKFLSGDGAWRLEPLR
jgi:hypothetical protein